MVNSLILPRLIKIGRIKENYCLGSQSFAELIVRTNKIAVLVYLV